MTFEEFQKARPKQLTAAAKECFERSKVGINLANKAPSLLEAQFYMQEIDRRDSSFIAFRDLVLEVIVIALIGAEIWLGWQQGKNEAALMDKQDTILSQLDKDTQDTAKLVQQQLELDYSLSVNVEYSGRFTLDLFNNSRSELVLAAARFGRMAPKRRKDEQNVVPDHNRLIMYIGDYNKPLAERIGAGNPHFPFNVELFLKNARGEEFIWRGQLIAGTASGNLQGRPAGFLVKERWNESAKVSSVP